MKTRFNLQPWREERRIVQQKRFIGITAVIVIALLALCGLNYYLEKSYINSQQEAIAILKSDISSLQSAKNEVEDTQALIAEINKQILSIETLQSQRDIALKLMDYLAKATPETVFLNSVDFDGEKLVVRGISENDAGVASFMRALGKSGFLTPPEFDGLESAKTTNRYVVPDESEIKSFAVFSYLAKEGV